MCFTHQKQKNTLKLNLETDLKNKLITFKDKFNLLLKKDFISRNYEKLKKIKESKSKNNFQFSLDKIIIQNKLLNFNSSRNINRNPNKIFFSLNSYKDNNNVKKLNKANSLINIQNINISNMNNKKVDVNRIINEKKEKNKNYKKIKRHPLSNDITRIRNLYLNITSKHKSFNFSINSSINSSKSKKILTSKNKEIKKLKNNKDLAIKKELRKAFFNNYIKKEMNKEKLRNKNRINKSLYSFNEIYNKMFNNTKEKNILFLRLKKSYELSKDFSFLRNEKNLSNLSNKGIMNDLMTSGSINSSNEIEDNLELNPEEIHFKSVKYYQEIKMNEIS